MTAEKAKQLLTSAADRLGFQACRVARADFLEEEAPSLDAWLAKGFHGSMAYMENHYDKRLDPRKLVPGAKSVVSLAYNYFPGQDLADGEKTAHRQICLRRRLPPRGEGQTLRAPRQPSANRLAPSKGVASWTRPRSWSAPGPSEAVWAGSGRTASLLRKNEGSFFFLAELIVDYDFAPDSPVADHCGTCTRCLDACPTGSHCGA